MVRIEQRSDLETAEQVARLHQRLEALERLFGASSEKRRDRPPKLPRATPHRGHGPGQEWDELCEGQQDWPVDMCRPRQGKR